MGLYQDPEVGSSSQARAGDAVGSLHRQYSPHGRVQGESTRPSIGVDIPVGVPEFHNKFRENNLRTISNPGIPRLDCEHGIDGAEPHTEKIKTIWAESWKLLEAEQVSV